MRNHRGLRRLPGAGWSPRAAGGLLVRMAGKDRGIYYVCIGSAWTGRVDVEGGVEARAGVSQLAVLRCPCWGFCSPGGGPGSECGDGPGTAQVRCTHRDHLAALRLRSRDTTNHEG